MLAHHRVSGSSVRVRACDWITEGRGFKSHLELGFFSELMTFLLLIFLIMLELSKVEKRPFYENKICGHIDEPWAGIACYGCFEFSQRRFHKCFCNSSIYERKSS